MKQARLVGYYTVHEMIARGYVELNAGWCMPRYAGYDLVPMDTRLTLKMGLAKIIREGELDNLILRGGATDNNPASNNNTAAIIRLVNAGVARLTDHYTQSILEDYGLYAQSALANGGFFVVSKHPPFPMNKHHASKLPLP